MQETLLRAWRHPEALDRRGSIRAWLFTVARNLVVDQHRARRSRPAGDGGRGPRRAARRRRAGPAVESWAVAEALAALRPEHREVLAGGLLPGEIGEGGGRDTRHPAGNGQVAHLLRASGAQARAGGAGARAMMMTCDEVRMSLGVYVLGALEPRRARAGRGPSGRVRGVPGGADGADRGAAVSRQGVRERRGAGGQPAAGGARPAAQPPRPSGTGGPAMLWRWRPRSVVVGLGGGTVWPEPARERGRETHPRPGGRAARGPRRTEPDGPPEARKSVGAPVRRRTNILSAPDDVGRPVERARAAADSAGAQPATLKTGERARPLSAERKRARQVRLTAEGGGTKVAAVSPGWPGRNRVHGCVTGRRAQGDGRKRAGRWAANVRRVGRLRAPPDAAGQVSPVRDRARGPAGRSVRPVCIPGLEPVTGRPVRSRLAGTWPVPAILRGRNVIPAPWVACHDDRIDASLAVTLAVGRAHRAGHEAPRRHGARW